MAAPIFAASAAGADITPPINIEGVPHSLARLNILRQSKLVNCSVDEIEDRYQVSVVLVRHNGESNFHPSGSLQILAGDVLAILGSPNQINSLVNDSQR
jgi:Trk K+ transport system NAD-binding subunit